MQFPVAWNAATDEPRLHRRRPFELHWRKDSPSWPGRLDSVYRRLYPQLADEFCCVQCGSVPCPFSHDEVAGPDGRQNEAEFIGRLVAEKAALEKQLAEVKDALEATKKQQRDWKTEKEMLQKRLADCVEECKVHERERSQMVKDAARQHIAHCQQSDELASHKKQLQKLAEAEQARRAADDDKQRQQQETETALKSIVADQLTRIERHREAEIRQNARIQDLENQLAKLGDEMTSAARRFGEHRCAANVDASTPVVRSLVAEATALLERRLRETTQRLVQVEADGRKTAEELEEKLKTMSDELEAARDERMRLESDLRVREGEVERLRRRLADGRGFRTHVEELRVLKEENQRLRVQLEEMTAAVAAGAAAGKDAADDGKEAIRIQAEEQDRETGSSRITLLSADGRLRDGGTSRRRLQQQRDDVTEMQRASTAPEFTTRVRLRMQHNELLSRLAPRSTKRY